MSSPNTFSFRSLLIRLGVSFLLSPFILFLYGALAPSTAYATDSGEEVDDSQTPVSPAEDASSEVIQSDASPESTQDSLNEASTAVATAESDLATTEQELQEVVIDEQEVTNAETQAALADAEQSVSDAKEAIESTTTAIADAEQKVQDWSDSTDAVQAQEEEVSEKEVVLSTAETALSEATPDYEESVTVTENFNDGTLDGVDVSLVGGSSVSSTTQNGITMHDWGERTDGISLKMYYPSADLLIDPTTDYTVYEFGFETYALNGTSEAVVTFVSESDAETTVDTSYVIPDSVTNNQVNDYKKTVTYTAPSGYSIDKVNVKATNDWWGIDNIYWSYYNYVIDPSYQQAVDSAESDLTSAEATLAEYQELETEKKSIAVAAEEVVSSLLSSAQSLVETAASKTQSAKTLVGGLLSSIQQAQPSESPSQDSPRKQEPVVLKAEPEPVEQVVLPEEPKEETPKEETETKSSQPLPQKEPTKEQLLPDPQKTPLITSNSTPEEKVDFILTGLEEDEYVEAEDLKDLGIEYEDLPEETPVSVRKDSTGESVVITAKEASQIETITNPEKFVETLTSDPIAAISAIGSIGKDMTEEEREESQIVVVASVIVSNVANLASQAAAAASGSIAAYRRKP